MTARLADVVAVLDDLYPPSLAEPWDAVGLVCGDPDALVRRVLFAVDPVAAVVDEVLGDAGFDLLVTHHPLWLKGTTSVAATTAKGRVVHRLLAGGAALHVAHTNADSANPGVSDALATLFDLQDLRPLAPVPARLDKLVVFVPVAAADRLLDALSAAGAGAVGDYERCAWTTVGTGTFRPLAGATPAVGAVGRVEVVEEVRLEVVLPRSARSAVLAALLAAHPYEEPAYDLLELAVPPTTTRGQGLGRAGTLPEPMPLGQLTALAARVLPATAWGVRATGDPDRVVRTLAVCGGSGDSLLDAAATADAYLTADLRHHPASEAPEGLALLDAAHWATEWPWLADAAGRLARRTTVETVVSTRVTDPWTHSARSPAT